MLSLVVFLLWAASTLAVWLFGLTLMLCFVLCIKVEYIKKIIIIETRHLL